MRYQSVKLISDFRDLTVWKDLWNWYRVHRHFALRDVWFVWRRFVVPARSFGEYAERFDCAHSVPTDRRA